VERAQPRRASSDRPQPPGAHGAAGCNRRSANGDTRPPPNHLAPGRAGCGRRRCR